MSAVDKTPVDQAARDYITGELDESIFVAAAAGSGKTKSLVDRILKLIDAGRDVDSIAAVTFTERAASELRDRIRRTLHDTKADADATPEVRERRETALHKIDGAMIGTLHGFAYRLLAENPIEAGLPVVFAVRDEATSAATQSAEWERRLGELIADRQLANDIRVLGEAGVRRGLLKEAAESLDDQWDLVEGLAEPPAPIDPSKSLTTLVRSAQLIIDMREQCADDTDRAYVAITDRLIPFVERAGHCESLEDVVALLGSPNAHLRIGNVGTKGNWGDAIAETRTMAADFTDACVAAKESLLENCGRRVIAELAKSVAQAAESRIEAGKITYDDLLVLTRRMLQAKPEVRRRLHERYRHILIDEFQDTDPLQLSITLLIAADPDSVGDHNSLIPLAGGVFLVGDPQQSIYAFRGADLKLYLAVHERVRSEAAFATEQTLSVNFRTVEGIISWVNGTFAQVITEREHSQPEFSDLSPHRVGEQLAGPAVAMLGGPLEELKLGEIRALEAEDIAATIVEAVGNWDVVDAETNEKRKARLGDIALLSWGRGRYPEVMDALDRAQIPFRAESASLTYTAQEVRGLLQTLRALDDPADDFSLMLALRSPLFGCGDDDLLAAKQSLGRGRIKITCDIELIDESNPVRESLEYLRGMRGAASIESPSKLLEQIAADRRLFELAHQSRRPRDIWRRVRAVIDQSREWTAVNGGSLAEYLEWAAQNVEDNKRSNEAILPETDDDAVQLETIHRAKGLEYPIVILFDLSNKGRNDRSPSIEIDGAAWEFYLNARSMSSAMRTGLDEQKNREFDERMRLLYVACTRARDHLVVCTHRQQPKNPDRVVERPLSSFVLAGASASEHVADFTPQRGRVFEGAQATPEVAALMPHAEWSERYERVRERAAVPEATAVTALIREEPATVATPRVGAIVETAEITVDVGPAGADIRSQRRIGGPRFGSAVHAVLEEVELDAPESVTVLAERAAAAEGIEHATADVAAIALKALQSDVLVRATTARRVWRELLLAREVDGRVVEGFVDLLFEDAGGNLVIVDYKTDAGSAAEFDEKVESLYAKQLGAYAGLVHAVTGQSVAEAWILHLGNDGVRELSVAVQDAAGLA